jgi:hypothetical protein
LPVYQKFEALVNFLNNEKQTNQPKFEEKKADINAFRKILIEKMNPIKTDKEDSLLIAVMSISNNAEKMDKFIYGLFKGDARFTKLEIGITCISDFLGIIWMSITDYYEPMRKFRNAIAHNQYQKMKGDKNQNKLLFFNVTNTGVVDWKLFCDKTSILSDFQKYVDAARCLFTVVQSPNE